MTQRIKILVDALPTCGVFADIGCDHGYVSKLMLDQNKCKKVIIADISAKCLEKAQTLLSEYCESGRVTSVVCDGFDKIDYCDLGLIAGMGGVEIISILKKSKILPQNLALQPMKNAPEVRQFAVSVGYRILTDKIFKAGGKFYDLLVLEKGQDSLTQDEILFGRTNVSGDKDSTEKQDFREFIAGKIRLIKKIIQTKDIKEENKDQLLSEMGRLERYV